MSVPPWAGGQAHIKDALPDKSDTSLLSVDGNPLSKWKEVVDPTSKKTYWYHLETKETTWVKPTLEVATPPATAKSAVEPPLQPGWIKYEADGIDPKTGQRKAYYHNAALKQTTWIRPSAPASIEPKANSSVLVKRVGTAELTGDLARDPEKTSEFRDHHGDLMNCCKWYPKCVHKVQATRDREGGVHYKKRRLQSDPRPYA